MELNNFKYKKILVFLLLGIVFLSSLQFTSAYFTRDHIYWDIKGFEEVSSPITEQCRPYLNVVLDGQHATDTSVLHYYDNKFMSYIGTHTRYAGYEKCMEEANDQEERCFCYGNGLHQVQDHFAHTTGGLVPKYLKKYFSSNLIGHMVIEQNYQDQLEKVIKSDSIVSGGTLDYYDSIVLNSFFQEFGGDEKYFRLLNEMSGLDAKNDVKIFRTGYLGEGFYNTVYQDKVQLPYWAWGLGIGLLLLGFGIGILLIWTGKTNYKWIISAIWIFIGIIGLIILYSFITGTTWKLTTMAITIPAKVGYLNVAQDDIIEYNQKIQTATNKFLETGILPYDDNSGLSYYNRNGVYVEGALTKAEKSFIIPGLIFLSIFMFLNYWLIRKSFKKKRK